MARGFKTTSNQSGFTAVELLITLFVAAIFLVAGYQLFNVVIKDGGEARAESRASNIAYTYMRKHSNAATNPCTPQAPVSNTAVTENTDGLADAKVSIVISCPQSDAPTVSKVEAIVTYNNPQQTMRFSTFVDKSKGATPNPDVTNGLVGWWKLNGDTNSATGVYNGTAVNAAPTTGQNGLPNNAYSFNGTNAYISIPAGFSDFSGGMTISVWAQPTASNNFARFIDFGNGQHDNNILFTRVGTTANIELDVVNGTNASYLTSITSTTNPIVNSQWKLYTVTIGASGTATLYANGVSIKTGSGASLPLNVTRSSNYIGRSNWASDAYYAGALDDLRIYNRALSASEVSQLFNGGAK